MKSDWYEKDGDTPPIGGVALVWINECFKDEVEVIDFRIGNFVLWSESNKTHYFENESNCIFRPIDWDMKSEKEAEDAVVFAAIKIIEQDAFKNIGFVPPRNKGLYSAMRALYAAGSLRMPD